MKTPDTTSSRGARAILALLSAGLIAASCCKEPLQQPAAPGNMPESSRISFFDRSAAAKGSTIAGSEAMERVFGAKGINIKAIHHSRDYFRSDEKLFCLSPGQWATCESYHWPSDAGDALNFWAWAFDGEYGGKVTDVVADDEALHLHFRMAASSGEGLDALRQQELVVGSCLGATRENSAGGVGLGFSHALSAVKINVGRANSGILRSITFSDVFSEADCTMDGSLHWSGHSGRTTFRQDFDIPIDGNLSDGMLQDVSASAQADSAGLVFMLIPQPLDGASIRVDYNLAGVDTCEVFSSALSGAWEPGRTYTYTLNILGGLSVRIDGQMTPLSATGVSFTNDGGCTCYLRATMVGTWDDSDGNIVRPASGESTQVVRDPRWDEFWLYDGESHIYYYRHPLHGGESVAVNLIDSFSALEGPEGTHLNMTVMVQAIKEEYKDTLFPDFHEDE